MAKKEFLDAMCMLIYTSIHLLNTNDYACLPCDMLLLSNQIPCYQHAFVYVNKSTKALETKF